MNTKRQNSDSSHRGILKSAKHISRLRLCFLIVLILKQAVVQAQDHSLKLMSTVTRNEKALEGVTVELLLDTKVISRSKTNARGELRVNVPDKGEYLLIVSYPGCNSKIFYINTNNVPVEIATKAYGTGFIIGSISMSIPWNGVDYSTLNQPLLKIAYDPSKKAFDYDHVHTQEVLAKLRQIHRDEHAASEEFKHQVKNGNEALKKFDCATAKSSFEKALWLMPGDKSALAQINKAEECLKTKKDTLTTPSPSLDTAKTTEVAGTQVSEKTETVAKKRELIIPVRTSESNTTENKHNSEPKNSIPVILGSNGYNETIARADELFRSKRYEEAKEKYEDALKIKPGDAYATKKLEEISILMNK